MKRFLGLLTSLALLIATTAPVTHADGLKGSVTPQGGGGTGFDGGIGSAGSVAAPIGGFTVGQAGTGMYAGFTLAWGEDFLWGDYASKLIGPTSPNAPYGASTIYSDISSRGNTSSLGSQWDVDPLLTGYNDANRGAAYGFTNWSVSNSILTLQTRNATTGANSEQSMLAPTDVSINGGLRKQVSAMIHTAGAVAVTPGSNEIMIEARMRMSHRSGNPAGAHPTVPWVTPLNPVLPTTASSNGNAWNFEGSSQDFAFTQNIYASGVATNPAAYCTALNYEDGTFHTVTLRLRNGSSTELWVDGASVCSVAATNSNPLVTPLYIIASNHVYNGSFGGETYTPAAWDADPDGITMSVDWLRVWKVTGVAQYAPLVSVADQNLAYNGNTTIVLPSLLSLWGDGSVSEYVQALPTESNEIGNTDTSKFARFPPGVTYNSGTRTITIDWTNIYGNAGPVRFSVTPYKNGSVSVPLRFTVNRGPFLTVGNVTSQVSSPVNFDVRAAITVGNIFPLTIGVTGLPAGLSFSSSTGLITGTPSENTSVATVTATNGLGQQIVRPLSFRNYQTETNVLMGKFVNALSLTKADAVDAFIAGSKTDTNWALLKMFEVYGMDDSQQSKIDWTGNNTVSFITATPTFTANQGYTTNGTTNGVDTGQNVQSIAQDNSMVGVYSRTVGQTAGAGIGTFNAGAANITLNLRSTTDTFSFRYNDNTADSTANTLGNGCFIALRDGATSKKAFRNGTQLGSTFTTASTGTIFGNYGVGAVGAGGSSFTARQFAAAWAGNAVGLDQAALCTRIVTLLTVFGAN